MRGSVQVGSPFPYNAPEGVRRPQAPPPSLLGAWLCEFGCRAGGSACVARGGIGNRGPKAAVELVDMRPFGFHRLNV
ncbi:hypothetical protein ACO22_06948 [Paracoccidioides brasiliensis]|uniref:Uncharacterized protein n=1 Tax=Paracoccidioides brasiliensis TaxID=121759 RepID=A0A1D2J6F1_PARBR|nr:hypothetical protein ACO22_06948 [Paracoccidioides brasiliensis]